MSYQDQSYLEEVELAEEDLRDAMESYDNAKEETIKAEIWEDDCLNRVKEYQEILEKLKNKDI